jgi:hypothetical protein
MEIGLHRTTYYYDAALTKMHEERDHIAIQVSLAWDEDPPNMDRLEGLKLKLADVEKRISRYRPPDA